MNHPYKSHNSISFPAKSAVCHPAPLKMKLYMRVASEHIQSRHCWYLMNKHGYCSPAEVYIVANKPIFGSLKAFFQGHDAPFDLLKLQVFRPNGMFIAFGAIGIGIGLVMIAGRCCWWIGIDLYSLSLFPSPFLFAV